MRVVVTGAGGQLATDLAVLLDADTRFPAWAALGLGELDITDPARVRAVLRDQARPAHVQGGLVVVNAAAYTAVDDAEADEDAAYAVNAAGPAHLAMACADVGATLVHLSTDYVFSGETGRPYEADDEPAPTSAYGRGKLAGEQAVRELLPADSYVVRTAWMYGAHGRNFVRTMVRCERERDTVDVVDDQYGSPTWSRDLAAGLLELLAVRPPAGVYHATGGGHTSWHGLAAAVFAGLGADPGRVRPVPTEAVPRAARRPRRAVLSDRSWRDAGLAPLRPWADALRAALPAIVAAG